MTHFGAKGLKGDPFHELKQKKKKKKKTQQQNKTKRKPNNCGAIC